MNTSYLTQYTIVIWEIEKDKLLAASHYQRERMKKNE
jgi:hypothetical protein